MQNKAVFDKVMFIMKNKLWQFIDNAGSFRSDSAHTIKSLYFPLCNKTLMSSISPDLHGDSKKDQNHFLLEPVSRINLSTSRASRNFWLYINPKKVWSTTGVSKQSETKEKDVVSIEAGLLWHKISRKNKNIGLSAEILSFIPASDDPIEIMQVAVTNISSKPISFTPTAAIPLYARSAENIRDHRQVTSLLHRIQKEKHGISVTPTLLFDEAGHSKNTATYFVYGIDDKGCGPAHIFPTQDEFCGESSDLEMPEAVFTNKPPAKNYPIQGKEAIGALRFKQTILKPRKTKSFSIIMGIANTLSEAKRLFKAFDTQSKIHNSLTETKKFWQGVSSAVTTETSDPVFDNWFKWVSIQPTLRKIFGNSFLPDFDYGKGGRGWRDLWQDALSLLFTDPSDVQSLLINNFSGIRVDGSNATIIGKNPGEFTADRNNISRVWMDHGVWPLLTTLFYIHQTGNTKILLEETAYFRDNQISRSRAIDTSWNPGHGFTLKTADGSSYKGTILEHILVENLVQFFNVGPNNFCRLENADWNDGLDMAYEHGESVAFSAMYAYNLKTICTLIDTLQVKKILIFKELYYLLDTLSTQQIDYSHNIAKQTRLDKYFNAVKNNISGEKIEITALQLTHDLTRKTEWLSEHIKKSEWLKEGFFNGYYDNDKQRVEGTFGNTVRMTLPGQVFPIISGIATDDHIKKYIKAPKNTCRIHD